ncbi:hypothetical protein L1987_56681 [Smallanthus sonchifolius]|uniref:Uncharacterized protein n=1 Tax=Smallanthus sonchifolius TaxID=185202 RepID=A0ACB9EE36_9ASTR|nr:hypothetical protein L1987_56681 [Smallanthus sonchifolius]
MAMVKKRPEQLLKRTQLMERWSRWEISNFEYLMQLNTLAGRSYNDITQYPIFPWILSDYKSTYLDLSNPSSYRDLSKPIGALNDDRLKKFQEKYSSFNDPVIPKYHYDSHYSTAGTVLYYLMRVEPFTTLSVRLRGGKFDNADRMFSDIGATWNGFLEDMNDVKELVPEMFYLPEILTNDNSIDFGTTQAGDKLDSVRLPPWAENPVDFMHKHQMALESEHVSAHLHEWIDLIFGYKQQGKEAISAKKCLFYVTYEGAVDIDKIQDPVQRHAVEDQVPYFGQTPSRLLAIPHIKKIPLSDVLYMQVGITRWRKTLEIAKGHCALVTCLSLSPDGKDLVSGSRDTTVLIWRIHRSPRFRSGSMSEPPIGTVTPTSVSATTAASCFIDKNQRRRIEGPIQVIRGHVGEIIDCCVNSDLGAVASCSSCSDILLHSVSRGRLLRKLHGVKVDMVRMSRNGVIVMWNNSVRALMSYSFNGILIARTYFPKSCSISCMEISFEGLSVLVFHTMRLEEGHDITAVTMNKDNTNLLVSTSEKQLILYTNPAVKFTTVVRRAGSKLIGLPRGTRRSRRSLASVSSDDE